MFKHLKLPRKLIFQKFGRQYALLVLEQKSSEQLGYVDKISLFIQII
jgi:hypothetical protein